jgi:hypothetical protein
MGRKKRRGHFCWCCGRVRPNEAFSGRGHARHLCKECSRLGAAEIVLRQQARNRLRLEEEQWVDEGPNSIQEEVEYITDCARKPEQRIVTLGELLFFSTFAGDAWMLDPGDGLAAPLCRGGTAIEVGIEESADLFRIGWPSDYRFDGDIFVTEDRETGYLQSIRGYPVAELRCAIARRLR